MTFSQFHRLIEQGEKSHVDFKLTCNAFNRTAGDQEKAKAELVKDICAMANNGAIASYLMIGIGDDRQTLQSVSDQTLNSQNVQTLVRDAIHPRPTIRFHRLKWSDAPPPFKDVDFVVIQIGPNARHAFRLARDFINWQQRFHFRKHEVWIRNEDTSDLATPEQIARLLGLRRMSEAAPEASFKVVQYQKLARINQLTALAADVRDVFEEMGAKVALLPAPDRGLPEHQEHFRVRLLIRGKYFIFRCVFLERLASKHDRYPQMKSCWMCEHGVIAFVTGGFSDAGKFPGLTVDSKARWGALGLLAPKKHGFFSRDLPDGFSETPFSILTLPKLSDTKRLRESLTQVVADLETDDVLFDHLDQARVSMHQELRRWAGKSPAGLAKTYSTYGSAERTAIFRRHLGSALQLMRAPKSPATAKKSATKVEG